MSNSVVVPEGQGFSPSAPGAGELIAGLTLPRIERFLPDTPWFMGLPAFAPSEDPSDLSATPRLTRIDVARAISDDCVTTLAALKALEDATAACKAAVIERLLSATRAEDSALCLDSWQREVSSRSCRAELATVLTITEGTATGLIEHSTTLIRELPDTFTALQTGLLSWGHALVITEETSTLRATQIPEESITSYEQVLLGKAACTVPSFKEKARRLREKTHPESITTRTKNAYQQRRLNIQHGHDGMSWLSLYLPAPTIEGIWDTCTYLAQNAQNPQEPPRTPHPHPTPRRHRRHPPPPPKQQRHRQRERQEPEQRREQPAHRGNHGGLGGFSKHGASKNGRESPIIGCCSGTRT